MLRDERAFWTAVDILDAAARPDRRDGPQVVESSPDGRKMSVVGGKLVQTGG